MDKLMTFEFGSLKVETFWSGGAFVPSKTYINNELVYSDDTFKPSILHCIDEPQTMVSLLGFLVLETDSVEENFFISRGAPKLDEWANNNEDAVLIRQWVNDYELREFEDALIENEMTVEDCLVIEKYITIH